MGAKLLRCGPSDGRRGTSRAVVLLWVVILILAATGASGCGDSGNDAHSESEKAADNEVLDDLLAEELSLIEAYAPSLSLSHGKAHALVLLLRGQDQAHVDALTKAIRGVGGETDAEATPREGAAPKSEGEALTLAYEAENAALDQALGSVPHLQTTAPRGLAASLAASHAQHLVLLRQALGAGVPASVPGPFEPGDEPPPERR
jgi:ferritin-like protein